jgi:WD40 repeat protein
MKNGHSFTVLIIFGMLITTIFFGTISTVSGAITTLPGYEAELFATVTSGGDTRNGLIQIDEGPDGTLFVGQDFYDSHSQIYAVNPDGSYSMFGSPSVLDPDAVTVNSAGTVFTGGDGYIYEITSSGSSSLLTGRNFYPAGPDNLETSPTDELYAIWLYGGVSNIYEVSSSGSVSLFSTGTSVTWDGSGNMYILRDEIVYLRYPSGAEDTVFTDVPGRGLEYHPLGFFLTVGDGNVYLTPMDGSGTITLASGFKFAFDVCVASSGDIFVTDHFDVYRIYSLDEDEPFGAEAGDDQIVNEGDLVQFNGSGAYKVTYPIWPVDISGNGQYLAVGWDKNVSFFSTSSNKPIWTYNTMGRVGDLKLSENGEFLVVGSYISIYFFNTLLDIPLWSVDIGDSATERYDGDPGNRVDMTRDGKYIAAAAASGRILVYDTTSSTPTVPYWEVNFGSEVNVVRFSGNSNYLSMGAKNGNLKLGWVSGRSINWTTSPGDMVYSSSLSYAGDRISCGVGNSHKVSLYSSASPTPLWAHSIMGRQMEQVISDDGNYLASANHWDGLPGTWSGFAFWDTKSSNPLWTYSTGTGSSSNGDALDMNPNGSFVVGGSRTDCVYLFNHISDGIPGWSASDGTPVFIFDTGGNINYNSVSLSYDGTYFAAGSLAGTLYLFSTIGTPHLEWTWSAEVMVPITDSLDFRWDLNHLVDSDADGNFTNDVDATGPTPTYVYGDDGNFIATLRVTDRQNRTYSDTCTITVLNVDPTVTLETPKMDVEIGLRVAGSKWSNVGMALYEDAAIIGYLEVERWPGNPNDNPNYTNGPFPTQLDLTKGYKAIVTYDPYPDSGDEIKGDQPNNGKDKKDNAGNPVWITLRFPNGTEVRIHHTFNTQQSKIRDSDHPNHIDPWEVDLNAHLTGWEFEVDYLVADLGSDDEILTFTYGSQAESIIQLNDPPDPDPYPSPEVNPRYIVDTATLIYEGSGTLILEVEDDDNIRLSTPGESVVISIK